MPSNIFSTYSSGENRVTASILAVLRALSLERTERLLGALLERPEMELVRFQNQPAKGGEGVPDAIILASCRILIETKIEQNAVKVPQIRRHLERLNKNNEATRVLLVLTSDSQLPAAIHQLSDPALAWASFFALDQAIEELLSDPREVVSEREAFLLRELQAMLVSERLLKTSTDVVVVAARDAWPEYQRYNAYICQPNRSFQPVSRIAFYTSGQIYPLVPQIGDTEDDVEFVSGRSDEMGKLINKLLAETSRVEGQPYKVMFLSPPDSKDTINLGHPIENDLATESGRPIAFTQGQRYVALDQLRKAKTTSDLICG